MEGISGCIVTYGDYEDGAAAAESLLANAPAGPFTLYIVDNASPDGTGPRMAQAFGGRPGVQVRLLPENLGFGGGHNTVLPDLESRYHAVINPDITLSGDALGAMAAYMDAHPDVAVTVPRLVFPDGADQPLPKRLPGLLSLVGRHLPLPGAKKRDARYMMLDKDLSLPTEIQFCTGSFFMIRTEVFKAIGGFDKRYFMYFEDVDLGREAAAHGKLVYLPDICVTHAWHRRTAKNSRHFFMQLRSMFVYFGKWGFKL